MSIDWDALVLKPTIGIFGEPCIYVPLKFQRFRTNGVFDDAYKEITWQDGVPVTQAMPVLGIKLSDFPNDPVQGDHLIARGEVYVVREVRLDGHGGCKLMLNYDEDFDYPS